jgi:hypothetical protein
MSNVSRNEIPIAVEAVKHARLSIDMLSKLCLKKVGSVLEETEKVINCISNIYALMRPHIDKKKAKFLPDTGDAESILRGTFQMIRWKNACECFQ